MKKLLWASLALLSSGAVATNAQDRPKDGSVSTEISFNPFDQSGNTFSLDGVKVRWFINQQNALRFKLGFSYNSGKITPDKDQDTFGKTANGNFKFDLGYERHWQVAKRADVYVGAVLSFDKSFAKVNGTVDLGDTSYDYSVKGYSEIPTDIANLDLNKRGYFGFGVAAVGGLDFYVYKGLFLGTELQFGINTLNYDKVEYKNDDTTVESKDKANGLNIGFNVTPVLRLGYTF